MRTVVFGSGNVAWHLCPALANAGLSIEAVYGRNLVTATELADRLGTIAVSTVESLPDNIELVILMVSDEQLPVLSMQLSHLEIPVAHTSGSMPIDVLSCPNRGVLYPLQTFTKDMQPDMYEIPFFIEASSPELCATLQRIASRISPRVFKADSYHRKVLHLSAVFACNFVNHLYHVVSEIAAKEDLDFDYLRPLILETTHKALLLPPSQAQTGKLPEEMIKMLSQPISACFNQFLLNICHCTH